MALKLKPAGCNKPALVKSRPIEIASDRKSHSNKLPPDVVRKPCTKRYHFKLDDEHSITAQVIRSSDEPGLPELDCRVFVHSNVAHGPTARGFKVPLDKMAVYVKMLSHIYNECVDKDLFSELTAEEE